MGKLFILIGITFLLIGALWTFIGKLPGDFTFKRGNVTFHFPLMTSIVISIVLSLILFILGKLR
ncbi:MAG TPA: DUF2905 domain-containing protein [Bacillota bacterium]